MEREERPNLMEREQIEAQLISTFLGTAGSFPIHHDCEQMMRRLIYDGVGWMVHHGKIAPGFVEKANDTVRAFTLEMKDVARDLHRHSIGESTFMPVMLELRDGKRQRWWPFTETA